MCNPTLHQFPQPPEPTPEPHEKDDRYLQEPHIHHKSMAVQDSSSKSLMLHNTISLAPKCTTIKSMCNPKPSKNNQSLKNPISRTTSSKHHVSEIHFRCWRSKNLGAFILYRILKDWNLKRQVEDNLEQDSSAESLPDKCNTHIHHKRMTVQNPSSKFHTIALHHLPHSRIDNHKPMCNPDP